MNAKIAAGVIIYVIISLVAYAVGDYYDHLDSAILAGFGAIFLAAKICVFIICAVFYLIGSGIGKTVRAVRTKIIGGTT